MLNHHLRSSLLILLATASLQIPAASDLSSLEEKTWIPFGYFDTSTSGAEKAAKDMADGKPRFALMGMPSTVFVKKLGSSESLDIDAESYVEVQALESELDTDLLDPEAP